MYNNNKLDKYFRLLLTLSLKYTASGVIKDNIIYILKTHTKPIPPINKNDSITISLGKGKLKSEIRDAAYADKKKKLKNSHAGKISLGILFFIECFDF
tara:strand:- start:27 stop:320 length:294 start_codon:yes stop_codon:yes gene_type:complete